MTCLWLQRVSANLSHVWDWLAFCRVASTSTAYLCQVLARSDLELQSSTVVCLVSAHDFYSLCLSSVLLKCHSQSKSLKRHDSECILIVLKSVFQSACHCVSLLYLKSFYLLSLLSFLLTLIIFIGGWLILLSLALFFYPQTQVMLQLK